MIWNCEADFKFCVASLVIFEYENYLEFYIHAQ